MLYDFKCRECGHEQQEVFPVSGIGKINPFPLKSMVILFLFLGRRCYLILQSFLRFILNLYNKSILIFLS